MRDVLKTNDAVLLNFAQALLADAGIEAIVFDGHMSVMDGSLGILPRRLMVADDDFSSAETAAQGRPSRRRTTRVSESDRRPFLNGRVIVRQPLRGFRSGLDAVMLAAAVPACAGDEMLELGAGAGAASLCLAARVPDCSDHRGRDRSRARRNRKRQCAGKWRGCACAFLGGRCTRTRWKNCAANFAHVFSNPPFHGDGGEASPDAARDIALCAMPVILRDWFTAGMKRVDFRRHFHCDHSRRSSCGIVRALHERGVAIFPLVAAGGRARQARDPAGHAKDRARRPRCSRVLCSTKATDATRARRTRFCATALRLPLRNLACRVPARRKRTLNSCPRPAHSRTSS